MPFVSPEVIAGITSKVLALPADVNPYRWLSAALKEEIMPQINTKPYRVMMWISVGFHAVALLCHLCTLFFRKRGNALWFFRKNNEQYLVPNVAVCFASIGIIYCVLAIAAQSELALYMFPELRKNLMACWVLTLMCLTLSAWMEVWSLAVSVIVMDDALTTTSTTKSRLSPRIINSTFAGMPILYICVAPVLTAFMNISWNNIISNTRAAFGQLEVDAANWTSGPVSLSTLQRLSKGLEKSESLFAALAHWEEACTCYEAAINSALLVIWLPLLLTTLKRLRTQINFMRQQTDSAARSGPNTSSMATDSAYQRKLSSLISLCRQRILVASVGYIMGIGYVACCLIPVIAGSEKLTTEPIIAQTFLVGAAVIYAVFGTPTSLVLCYVSYTSFRRPVEYASRSSASAKLSTFAPSLHRSHPVCSLPQGHLERDVELDLRKGDVEKQDE